MPPTMTRTAHGSKTFIMMKKPLKAKNASNQAAIDRLFERMESAAEHQQYQAMGMKRAMKSVAACPEAIETRKQATDLKFVGPHIASIIVPNEVLSRSTSTLSRSSSIVSNKSLSRASSVTSNASSGTDAKPRKRQRQTKLLSRENSIDSTISSKSIKQVAYEKAVQDSRSLKLNPSGWKAILVVDGREQKGEHVLAKLKMSGIPCESRHLPIGDMAWIAVSGSQEVMLGTIVERKQVNDLSSSLFGTRYQEQRLRLQHSGLSQVLLLVEGDLNAVHNCPAQTLKMAMMETRIQLGFHVVQTRHLDDTVRFLKTVHRRVLQRSFPSAFGRELPTSLPSFRSPNATPRPRKKKRKSLEEMTMDTPPVPPCGSERLITYNELKAKILRDREAGTRTVGAIHLAMLKQIASCSDKKVKALGQAYPTPSHLMRAFDGLTDKEGKALVKDLSTSDVSERKSTIGPKSAEEIYNVCTHGGDPSSMSLDQAYATENEPFVASKPSQNAKAGAATTTTVIGLLDSESDHSDADDFVATGGEKEAGAKLKSQAGAATRATLANEWPCGRCKMLNLAELDFCQICGSPSPSCSSTVARMPSSNRRDGATTLTLNTSSYGEACHNFDSTKTCSPAVGRGCSPIQQRKREVCIDISLDDSSDEDGSVVVAAESPLLEPSKAPYKTAASNKLGSKQSASRLNKDELQGDARETASSTNKTSGFITLQGASWDDSSESSVDESLVERRRKKRQGLDNIENRGASAKRIPNDNTVKRSSCAAKTRLEACSAEEPAIECQKSKPGKPQRSIEVIEID